MSRTRRTIFVKGLGNLQVRQISPSAAAAFTDLGYLGGTNLTDIYNMQEVKDERGNFIDVLEAGQNVKVKSSLMQTDKAQLDIVRAAKDQYHAARYFGKATSTRFQYFCFDLARIIPNIEQDYKVGLRPLPILIQVLDDEEQGFDVPQYYLVEVDDVLFVDFMNLFVDPRQGLNTETAKILDLSGFFRHGTLNSDFAAIWQQTTTPAEFLRFDGVNDQVDFGDVLDDNATGDFIIEAWVRIQGANASLQEILAKKTAVGTSAGFGLWRNTSNQIQFQIADGTNEDTVTSTTTLLQNVWKHVMVAVNRDGNAQIYFNGVADGSPVDVSGVLTAANALNLYLGRDNTNFGQVDLGAVRIHRLGNDYIGASGSVAMATVALNHYNAEKAYYGL